MRLDFDEVPAKVQERAEREASAHLGDAIADRATTEARLTRGMAVYSVPSTAFGDTRPSDALRQVGWFFVMLTESGNVIATIEIPVVTEAEGGRLQQARFGESVHAALLAAEDVDGGSGRARLLDLSELFVRGIWIGRAEEDLVIPLEPAPPPLVPNQAYLSSEFEVAVRTILETRLAALRTSTSLR
jgi:hypothetical protein